MTSTEPTGTLSAHQHVDALFLGQAGVRFTHAGIAIYLDPYLSDSVALRFGDHLRRLTPAPLAPTAATDATWVLITHEHLDHLDPDTLSGIGRASPRCRFMCPTPWIEAVVACGISPDRVLPAREEWTLLAPSVSVRSVPAAHPSIERDSQGHLLRVGYLLDFPGLRVYHSGDTSPDAGLVNAVRSAGPVDVALLPFNERNYYRDREGILGNMSVREALAFGQEIGARAVVPIHWDLFAPNSVLREEIELLYRRLAPPFTLAISPESLPLRSGDAAVIVPES